MTVKVTSRVFIAAHNLDCKHCVSTLPVNSYRTTNKMHLFLKLFILVKRSTCFWRSFRSSGAQNWTYGNRRMSNSCCYLLLAGTLAAAIW